MHHLTVYLHAAFDTSYLTYVSRTFFFCDGTQRYGLPAHFIDDDASRVWHKFRTREKLSSFVPFLPPILLQYETNISIFFSTKIRDILNFTCFQEMNTGKFCFNRDKVLAYSFKQTEHCHHNSSRHN
jgi:hypothetical protein